MPKKAAHADKSPRGWDGLTDLERRFVDLVTTEFIGNHLKAGAAAGLPKTYLKQHVHRLMKRQVVKDAIAERMRPSMEKAGITRDEIVAKLAARFRDKNVANIDMVRIGGLLADMMPGARVPVGLKVTGLTLEDFINQGREAETGETHGTVQASESIESGDSPPSARTH